jgi:predicted ATPase/class 3 adenylate cyclase/DNA-binding XRE family transcriptional regulator
MQVARPILPQAALREGSRRMTSTTATGFGDLLRRHRLTAGLTQAELAERAGLSVRGINDLERGTRQHPRKDTVALLAQALDLTDEARTAFAAAARGTAGTAPADSTSSPPPPARSAATAFVPALPTGTVTFLFTDIAGSTHLLQQLGAERYTVVQADYCRLLRAAVAAHGGHEVDTQGDGFFVAFATAPDALLAAAAAQRAFATYPWPEGSSVRVRMGLHSGTAQVAEGHYVGLDVHRAARIAAAGHGGQVLLSQTTRALVELDLPVDLTVTDLGAHRLKDLQHPEPLAQLVIPGVPADFPALATLDAHPHNLPIQPTALLGRAQDMEAVCALLRRDDVRLVTLTGPGGVGKTRLGLQVAAELVDEYTDGVWFVRLSRLIDPPLVLPTIAQTLGLREAGSVPLAALLHEYARTRHLLLLLDNFEQVVGAAPQVAELLATSPDLTVLVTSRAVLRLRGEHEYPVSPLALPASVARQPFSAVRLLEAPAVALFVEQARTHRPDFTLKEATGPAVAAICARLDGLPLALELAAARVKLLAPATLLRRLERVLPLLTGGARDLEERQQTLRATLSWSEELLQPEEQRLFRRLAVFVGGFTLKAAEAVCAAPEGVPPLGVGVLEGLEALVDQSLVQPLDEEGDGDGAERFRLLYVVREYALERLEASGEAEALRRAHAVYYLGWVEERAFAVWGAEGVAWLGRLEREHDNCRAALAWARERGEVELGLRLAAALSLFWYVRGYFTEGRGWLEALLALAPRAAEDRAGGGVGASSGQVVSVVAQAKALAMASNFAWVQEDDTRALAAAEALALARGRPAGWVEGVALATLGNIAWDRGDLERATAYMEEGVAQLLAVDEPVIAATYLARVGGIALDRGDLERARACCEESLAFARRTGADFVAGTALGYLAQLARRQGDLAGAEELGREQLLVWRRLDAPSYLAGGLEGLAVTAAAAAERARVERAARLLAAAAALRERVGAPHRSWGRADIEWAVAEARLTLGEGSWAAAFAAGRALTLEEAIAEALGEHESAPVIAVEQGKLS